MSATLPRPGVQVVQEFRSVSPTVVTPTLVPCIVGVAKQLVEILETSSSGSQSLNTNSLINLPAFCLAKAATGSPVAYTGLDGLVLELLVNNAPAVAVTFADPTASGLTPATVVSQINDRLSTLDVTSFLAETVGDDKFQVRTVGLGEFQQIVIGPNTADVVAAAFEWGIGRAYVGIGNYNNYQTDIPVESFPDPNNNHDELGIEYDTVRVFLGAGGGLGLIELERDESFLSNGEVHDAATCTTGTVDLSGLTMAAETLTLFLDESATSTDVVFTTENGVVAILAVINAVINPLGYTAIAEATTNYLIISADNGGDGYTLQITATGGGQVSLGLTVETVIGYSIAAVDDGNGDVLTPLVDFEGEDFTASATQAVATAAGTFVSVTADTTLIISDGKQEQTIVFLGTESTVAGGSPDLQTTIEAVMGATAGGKLTVSDNAGALVLTHADKGDESFIRIVGGTALPELDPGPSEVLVAGAEFRGVPFPPIAGDELYLDGVFYANINDAAPGAVVDRLKLDRQVTISSNIGRRWYIIAKGLPVGGSATRPYPDLAVSATTGLVEMKHSFMRDTAGDPMDVVAPIYLSYTAVRQDVTSLASSPGLLTFANTTELTAALPPVNTDNPLALGLYYALINATGAQVTGLGVDAISADSPYGTVEAFTRAAEYLESFEVYALAPLTHDNTVGQLFNTHVDFMSEPEQKGERIVLFHPDVPTRALDTLVASDTNGDRTADTTFDTKVAALTALLQNAGIDPLGTIAVTEGLYLDIASDDKKYSIKSISGSVVTVRTVAGDFAAGENEDSYYATNVLPTPLISETFAVRIRGAELLTVGGLLDKNEVAATLANMGQAYQNRRFWLTFPDQARATIGGFEQLIEGFYMNAAISGMIGQQPPQQSFTNFPMTGFTAVVGSNDTYSEGQLNAMAAGGVYVIVQDSIGAPLISRMALTTDMTSIETRTDSITKVVDFVAKFMRRGLKNFIGRFNITQSFLDSLGSVVQGLIGFLVEAGVLIGGQLNNIIQDEDTPDTVLIDVTLDVPYPCNYIRLTLVV